MKTYSYDNNGNNIQIVDNADPVKTIMMTYDCLNRLLSWSDGTNTESNAYRGAEWHRTSQAANGAMTSFLYDGANVVADIGTSIKNYELRINELPKMEDVSIKFYVTPFLDQNLSMTTSGQTYYYLQDGLGSVRNLTTSSGAAVNRYAYTAFGEPHVAGTSETIPQRYGYTGREKNPLSGTNSNRYRTLHPTLGRFSSRDPIGYSGGINLYGYVHSRSTKFSDPWGLLDMHDVAVNKRTKKQTKTEDCSCGRITIKAGLDASETKGDNFSGFEGGTSDSFVGTMVHFEWISKRKKPCCCKDVGWKQWYLGRKWLLGSQWLPDTSDVNGWYEGSGGSFGAAWMSDYAGGNVFRFGPRLKGRFKAQIICKDSDREGEVLYTIYWEHEFLKTWDDGAVYGNYILSGGCGDK